MYSVRDTLAGGFPHSEIPGSKLICQLPQAFRRLSRLSSPIIAKASTTCSESLDPITLTSPKRYKAISRTVLSGLSPDALCRNVNDSSDISILRTIRHYLNFKQSYTQSFSFVLTQSKLSSRARLHLHAFPLTTLISTL